MKNIKVYQYMNPKSYALATVHRAENTDDPERLSTIFKAFKEIAENGLPVVVPLHPRTRNALSRLSAPSSSCSSA